MRRIKWQCVVVHARMFLKNSVPAFPSLERMYINMSMVKRIRDGLWPQLLNYVPSPVHISKKSTPKAKEKEKQGG